MTNSKQTKKALLSSVIALILCFSMLIGTTFAWFTDSVQSGLNEIKAGNLDVELYHKNSYTSGKVNEGTKLFVDKNGDPIWWEPGVVVWENLTVANEGSLALKYQLAVNFTNENATTDGYSLSQVLKVGVVKDGVKSIAREDVVKEVNAADWMNLAAFQKSGELLTKGASDVYGIVIWWEPSDEDNNWNLNNDRKTTDGKDYLHIDLGVSLYATQKEYEEDSFDENYDKNASVTVTEDSHKDGTLTLAQAIAQVEDGGIVFVEPGEYTLKSMIVVDGKSLSIIGLGDVYITTTANQHMFTIQDQYDPESDVVVNLSNLTLDGKGVSKHGINVKYNVTVNMENVTVENTGWAGVLLDNANKYNDGKFYEGTATRVNMDDCDIVSVSLDALPVVNHSYANAGVTTYAYLNYDPSTTIGSLEIQNINKEPVENIFINGVAANTIGTTMNLYVKNDAELAEALNTIKTIGAYWNKQVYVYLAAGTYSGDYVINQYPQWNGVAGAGNSGNNYASGVPAGAPSTVITFIGEAATTYSLRATSAPAVVFTGKVTVNGFGNAGTSFDSTSAITTFQNIAFDGANIAPVDGNVISVELTAAADNVYFENCAFQNTTHVVLGYRAENRIDNVYFTGCTFTDAGSLSGYPLSVDLTDCVVDGADDGFLNIQNKATVSVTDTTANIGRFFIRTNGSDVEVTVQNSNITVYESEGTKHLVYFRGSNESAEFIDCTIADGYTTAGVDFDSKLIISGETVMFTDENGLVYYRNSNDEIVLYNATAFTGSELKIPEGVIALGTKALEKMTNLKTVKLPSTLESVGWSAFSGCSSLESVVIPGDVTLSNRTSGSHAHTFASCTSLSSVVIEEGVTMIPTGCFVNCTGLSSVVIPSTMTSLEKKAFYDCLSLETVYILSEDCEIGYQAFDANQSGFKNMTIYVMNEAMKTKVESNLTGNNKNSVTVKVMNIVNNADELAKAVADGLTDIYLMDGEYNVYGCSGKTLTLSGSKNAVLVVAHEGEYGCDYGFDGSTVTFNGVSFDTIKSNGNVWPNYARMNGTFNNCTFNGTYAPNGVNSFTGCTFNVTGNNYNLWLYGASTVSFEGCTFNCDGKSIYVDGNGAAGTNVTVNKCIFNDNGDGTAVNDKAAIETGKTYGQRYELIINNTTVNGFVVNPTGLSTNSTLWANKHSMGTNLLNVVVDGVDVY